MVCIAEENSPNQFLDACLSHVRIYGVDKQCSSLVDDNSEEATYKLPFGVCHEEKHFEHPFDVKTSCKQQPQPRGIEQ
jgi:hypothetical protein